MKIKKYCISCIANFIYRQYQKHPNFYSRVIRRILRFFLVAISSFLAIRSRLFPRRSILYVGHMYYYPRYLSIALRKMEWRADVLNWDPNPGSSIYYHGEDFKFDYTPIGLFKQVFFYIKALFIYDIFHFCNAHGISFSYNLDTILDNTPGEKFTIAYLKMVGKKIVYSHNACFDGVSQSAFSKWGPISTCSICSWRTIPDVCSDQKNLDWGRYRNSVADFQCTLGGNRVDCNDFPTVHEVPEFYCLDPTIWSPDLLIPRKFQYQKKSDNTVLLYHGVGNKDSRTNSQGVNIHTSHIYFPLVEKLILQGLDLEITSPTGIPNKDVRFLQAQSDIFLDMLTYGWFGAMAREAMMLGKPVICYLRPEWLKSVSQEIPDYINELPILNATPQTVEFVLKDLILDKERRLEVGHKSRAFALKWHSASSGANRFDRIYTELLKIAR